MKECLHEVPMDEDCTNQGCQGTQKRLEKLGTCHKCEALKADVERLKTTLGGRTYSHSDKAVENLCKELEEENKWLVQRNQYLSPLVAIQKEELDEVHEMVKKLEELISKASPIMWAMTGDDASAGNWEKEAEQTLTEPTKPGEQDND